MTKVRVRMVLACFVLLIVASGFISGSVAGLDAEGRPSLETSVADNRVAPGSDATITVTIGNDGIFKDGAASDRSTVTTARSVVADLKRSGSPIKVETTERQVGKVPESDPQDADFAVTVPKDASPGTYTLDVELDYSYTSRAKDTSAYTIYREESKSKVKTVKIKITDDAQFDVVEVNSSLRVGEEGRLTGRLRNIGATRARNTEITFSPSNENINALSSTIAVDDVSPGDSVPFSIPVEVTSNAEAVPHRFDLTVTYRDEDGVSQSTDDPDLLADIGEHRDAFLVEPVSSTVTAGNSRPLDIRVTNNLDEPVTDIEGKLFADDPLDSTNDETFTEALDPGETTTVTADISAAGGATIKTYPASIDFRYVDSDGDSKLTDSYQMAITVTEPQESGGPPIGPIVGVLALVAVGGVLLLRRR